MGERALENRAKKLKALEQQIKELESQADAIKAEIKAEMEARGTDELHTVILSFGGSQLSATNLTAKLFRPRTDACMSSI